MYSSVQATSRYLLGLLLARPGVRGPTLSGVSSQHTAYARVIRARIRSCTPANSAGGAGEQAVHEPDRGRGPGQRLQQRHHPVRGHEVHDHQVDRERGQVRAVPDRAGPGALGSGRGVDPPAPAARTWCWSYWVT